jgi:NADH:ubiquinone oxidoreductase subunit 5 (subunit L)/multisubunit Na+/H+ antiporter MnhA subunit
MSGVIIKIGIYGILRLILLVKADYIFWGYFLLIVSAISGLYGVMLAIIQHNLKKLLAYHSIENIGIIGLGVGLGTLGIGLNSHMLVTLGFAGGLLHVLNHSLFKSLLFYGAGNIYQSMHTVNLDQLGGAGKMMSHTSILFLTASLAICGLPPFNGFISEFLIYSGLFRGMGLGGSVSPLVLVSAISALALIGGLAILCFTKAYGSVFLGNPRTPVHNKTRETGFMQLAPMYLILMMMLGIGIFPHFFLKLLSAPLELFYSRLEGPAVTTIPSVDVHLLQNIGLASAGFIALAGAVYLVRKLITSGKPAVISTTWGCGYTGSPTKMQYTASSFIRSYRKLTEPVLWIDKKKIEVRGTFPHEGMHETHPGDKAEKWLIDAPLNRLRYFFNLFRFLQNGNPQYYILYGVVFISLVIGIPVLFEILRSLVEFLTRL